MAAARNRARTKKGRQRSDVPRDVWRRRGPKLVLGREDFEFWALYHNGKRRIDSLVESCSWEDVDAILRGEITVRGGDRVRFKMPRIDVGDQIQLKWRRGQRGRMRELWRMRITEPRRDLAAGTAAFSLANDVALLQGSTDDFKYGRGKRWPKGPRTDQVVRDVCRRYGVKIGEIPRGRHRVRKLVMAGTSPWEVIVRAMALERSKTGRRYVLSMDAGRLNIRPLRRTSRLLLLGPLLTSAAMTATRNEFFATAATVRGTTARVFGRDSKGRKRTKKRKIAVKVRSPAGIKRYGRVHRILIDPSADSPGEARAHGRRHLARVMRPTRDLPISHPGIPGLKRGDALRVALNEPGLRQVVFVREARFVLGPGTFTMDVSVTFDDPYVDTKLAKIYDAQDAAAKERNRVTPGSKDPGRKKARPKKKTPAKGKQRTDAPRPYQPGLGERIQGRGRG